MAACVGIKRSGASPVSPTARLPSTAPTQAPAATSVIPKLKPTLLRHSKHLFFNLAPTSAWYAEALPSEQAVKYPGEETTLVRVASPHCSAPATSGSSIQPPTLKVSLGHQLGHHHQAHPPFPSLQRMDRVRKWPHSVIWATISKYLPLKLLRILKVWLWYDSFVCGKNMTY